MQVKDRGTWLRPLLEGLLDEEVLTDVVARPQVHLHTPLADLGLDSMATIELLFKIEEVYDLQIPDQDLQKLVRVSDVIAYVEGKVGKPAATPPAKRPASKKKG